VPAVPLVLRPGAALLRPDPLRHVGGAHLQLLGVPAAGPVVVRHRQVGQPDVCLLLLVRRQVGDERPPRRRHVHV
jgi:hypothetical protein